MTRFCNRLKNLALLLTIAAAAVACSQDLPGQIDTYLAQQVRVLKILRSFLLLLPDDGIGLVLASNWEQADTGALARGILDIVLAAVDR